MPARRIWTIGHSTRPIELFLELLQRHSIAQLADIRTIPQSKKHPHFGRAELERHLTAAGISYRHVPALGGLRKPKADSPNGGWRNQSFRGYADHMLTADFNAGIDELLRYAESGETAIMCAEAVWWRCHRMLVSDALVARQIEVQHILSESKAQPHRLTDFARVRADGLVWYPGLV